MTKTWLMKRCLQIWDDAGILRAFSHSFRIGGSTELLLTGVPLDIVAILGGWTSLAFLLYWCKIEPIVPMHIGKAYDKANSTRWQKPLRPSAWHTILSCHQLKTSDYSMRISSRIHHLHPALARASRFSPLLLPTLQIHTLVTNYITPLSNKPIPKLLLLPSKTPPGQFFPHTSSGVRWQARAAGASQPMELAFWVGELAWAPLARLLRPPSLSPHAQSRFPCSELSWP
jgi:hypothetical protein